MPRIGSALLLLLVFLAPGLAAEEIISGTYLQFIVQYPPLGPVAGEPYVQSLHVISRGARSAVFDWQLPEKVEWIDQRCVAKGGNTWRCTLTDLSFGQVENLEAQLTAPLSAARQSERADLVSSDPPESRDFAHIFTVWPRSPGDLVVHFIPFDTTDAQGHAELRLELESRRAPLNAPEVRIDMNTLFNLRILEMQLPDGWNCTTTENGQILSCRVPAPATGEKVTAVFKVHALKANLVAGAAITWSDRGFPSEERRFSKSFLVYVREQIVTNTNDSGPGSLRQAMLDASNGQCNSYLVPCRIRFDIPPPPDGQWLTIRPETPLPVIARPAVERVTIDGTTQTRRRDSNPLGPEIELDGSLVREGDGLTMRSSGIIKGLAIHSFPGSGIEGGGGTRVEENYIGTDATGRVARPNGSRGVTMSDWSFEVENNVISGNARSGVFSLSGSGTVRSNLIGVAADGVTPLPNGASGVFGGPGASLLIEDNLIAHNRHFGIGIVLAPQGSVLIRPSIVARANRTYGNALSAIDQGLDGPGSTTPQAPPVLTSAVYEPATDSTLVSGSFSRRTDPGLYSYTIHLYANSLRPSSGFGEGERYLGALAVPGANFTFRVKGNLAGQFLSAHIVRFWAYAELSEAVTSEFGNVVEAR